MGPLGRNRGRYGDNIKSDLLRNKMRAWTGLISL
jgi:hypothetical protein